MTPRLMLLLPDLALGLLPFAVLAADLFANPRQDHRPGGRTAVAGFLIVAVLQLLAPHGLSATYVHNFVIEPWGLLFKQLFVLCGLLAAVLSFTYFGKGRGRSRLSRGGEYFALLAFCTGGMSAIVSANDLVMLFVSLELATIPLYVMTAFYRGEEGSSEAAIKYIIMGSVATALILFGYSLIYGACGVLHFEAVAATPPSPLLTAGLLFVMAAVSFKLAAAPFHMWAPDVYEGAPTPVTAFISVASKAAAFGFLLRLMRGPFASSIAALAPVFVGLAILSMVVGNLGAMRQRNFRRFMAYSSIAQVGYLLLALLAPPPYATGAILTYLFIYTAGNMAAFYVFTIAARDSDETMDVVHGLHARNPLLAAILMLAMFSLAGVPPLGGFVGKIYLFAGAAEAGRFGLVLFASLNSVASLFYYMTVIRAAYITSSTDLEPIRNPNRVLVVIAVLLGFALVVLGILAPFHHAIFRLSA